MVDIRRKIVETEETQSALWVARPIPPPNNVTYGVSPPEIIVSRKEFLEWLSGTSEPVTETGTITNGPVNVRSGPGTSYPVIGSLATGKTFTCYKDEKPVANGHVWRKLVGQQIAWIAETYTSLAPVVTPPPPPPVSVRSTIGIHVADSGNAGDLRNVISRAAKTKYPVPGIVVVNDAGLVNETRKASPSTIVVFRGGVTGSGDMSPFAANGSADGAKWVDQMWSAYHAPANASYHQMYNEVTFGDNLKDYTPAGKEEYARNMVNAEIAMMTRANQLGIKLSVGNYTAGVPDPTIFGEWLAPIWDFAETHGHAALFHWYSHPGSRDLNDPDRYYMLDRFLDYFKRWPKLQIVIGENGLYDVPRWTSTKLWTDAHAALKPYVKAGMKIVAMSWTIKGQDDPKWRNDDWTPYLPEYERMLAAGTFA